MDKLIKNLEELYSMLSPCSLCPLECNSLRLKGQVGKCNSNIKVKISASVLYPGEEPPLSGKFGSGTIFFSNCNLKCVYCQNFQFSQLGNGKMISLAELSKIMIQLQHKGAANINLVTPTQYFPQAASAIYFARKQGLKIPIVLNTSGYEKVEVLKKLENFIDIYLTDFRYIDDKKAIKYSKAPNYVNVTTEAVREMLRQKPSIKYDKFGLMKEGVIIRVLVFPGMINDLRLILKHIAREFGHSVYISLLSQYVPVFRACEFPEISRKLTKAEIMESIKVLREEGFKNGWVQYG